jgi:glyoxalase/bleomycin resistance protein/dioxygenase superfamily protein
MRTWRNMDDGIVPADARAGEREAPCAAGAGRRRVTKWHADGERQTRAIDDQFTGRDGFVLRVDDFRAAYERMRAAGVVFVGESREEEYGRVAVFLDVSGSRWDLLGPGPGAAR